MPALAQGTWPTRPVKLILPYAPGGATDFIGRPWAEKLQQAFGQPFVIDNRGGASGAIGTEAAARSTPDGYTLLLTPGATLTVLPLLRKVGYDARKDFVPVADVGDLVCGFVIVPSLGITSIKELVDYARKNPGKLAYGSAGLGTYSHMRIEMLKLKAGIDILHVPYRGSADALNDLLSGQVQMMNEINVLPHVKAGKLKLLDINYGTRHPDFPDVPTLTEAGYPGYRRADPVHHPGAGGGFAGHHRGVEPQDPGDRQDAGDDRPHARDQCGRAAVDAGAGGGGTEQGDRIEPQADRRGEGDDGLIARAGF